MDENEKIEELEGLIVDLRFDLKKSKDKEMVYLDILSNIDNSLKVLFKREQENERFNLGDDVNYRECIENLSRRWTNINEFINYGYEKGIG